MTFNLPIGGKIGQVDKIVINLENIDEQVYNTLDANENVERYFNNYTDLMDQIKELELRLHRFWSSYFEIVNLLLNVKYACRACLWIFLLECICEIKPYAFTIISATQYNL